MRRAAFLAVGVALTTSLVSRTSFALTATLDPTPPVTVGTPQSFRVAVEDATGVVSFTWNYNDGTAPVTTTDASSAHTFRDAGHYPVLVLASDEAGRTSATAVQTVFNPPTATAPSNSGTILLDGERHKVWTVNADNDTVTVIDTISMQREREIPVGTEPRGVGQAPDGSVWVVSATSDEVVILGRDSGEVAARIPLPYASQPTAVAFGPTGNAYVTLFATGTLVEIDVGARAVKRQLALGPTPRGVAVAADGRVFVTRFISPADRGEVWVVSPSSFQVSNTILLGFDKGPDTQSSGRGVPNYVSAIVISPDGTQAWVTAKKDNTARGPQRDGLPMTPDNFVRPAVCTIDLKTETEILDKRQDIDNRATPVTVAFSALGDYAFVLIQPSNWIGIVDAYSKELLSGIREVGSAPDGLVISSGGALFVNAYLSREVIVYDLAPSLASLDHAAPEPMARTPTVDNEPLSPEVLRGKKIFFNAADTRMGHAGYLSCVSCHFDGLSDGRVWDFSDRGEGLRNTKSLLGIRGVGEGRLHWSANFDEMQDFERDIRHDFAGSGFMSDAEFAARTDLDGRYDPFSQPAAGVSAELDALAAYINSLDKVRRSPFRNPDGSFTAAAQAGREVFKRAHCPECHSGPDLTDSALGMLHDVGTLLPTSGGRLFGPLTGIDTPSLKGVWQTAPYYHDGRAATLMQIFTEFNQNDQMGVTSNLTPTELEQLVEYLQELDDVPEPAGPTGAPGNAGGGCGACAFAPSSAAGSASTSSWSSAFALALALILVRARRRPRG